ncbi:cytochrome P450 CYP749A22-like [Papaver somniferum]|uniref:cytochrome P450 CYP749A22-like n=1 Tax=Papaver somniferum TaxID=3469 RepID=UPI000E6FDAF8|nr:cytochrome P450 CYP749A22-like [Papaver somniferum]
MHKSILKIINKREAKLKMGEVDGYGNDFLGSLIVAYHENKRITLEDLIDECKTFYDAGHETATALLTWTCLLLATHADWQEKARNEVIELLKEDQSQNLPTYENILPKLKTMNMIINETLRL